MLAVSQNSLNILKGGVAIVEGSTTSATTTDEPLSLLSNDDPGYETVRSGGNGHKMSRSSSERKTSLNETSSEHDPNYETLLPNATVVVTLPAQAQPKPRPQSRRFGDDEEDDGYSKIKPGQPPPPATTNSSSSSTVVVSASSCTDNEGYSSIRSDPQTIMASIDIEDEEEEEDEPGYSQIGTRKIKSGKPNDSHGYASIDETKKDHSEGYSTIAAPPSLMTMSTTSATTTNSSVSPISPIAYFPAPSGETSSYSSNTSPESEFCSIGSAALVVVEGNNYESLTSDDPNYETVRHLRITENPYEVLENELGTPGGIGRMTTLGDVEGSGGEDRGKVSPSDSPEVGDYFQV